VAERKHPKSATRLIACDVFRPPLEHLKVEAKYPHLHLTFLPSNLHLRSDELKKHLSAELITANRSNEQPLCLYGSCFPDIDEIIERLGGVRVPGFHCFEMLLGHERYEGMIDEMAGTYFLERELILSFENYCLEPLQLHDPVMRESFFRNYERVVYIRQPTDPDLFTMAGEIAAFLRLPLEVEDADYRYLEKQLMELLIRSSH
jgi:hypothetical protein